MTIGEKIKNRRKELGYSQEKLGELSGLTQSQVSLFERSISYPYVPTLILLCKVLGLTPNFLLGFEDATLPAN